MKEISDKEEASDVEYCEGKDPFLNNGNSMNVSRACVQDNKTKAIGRLVSVIMPVYNTPPNLLRKSVYSVINQTYRNLELIIIDDGSEEECSYECDSLKKIDDRITLIHINNSGVSNARNVGIKESKGDYIAFIDSDDTMSRNAIQSMVEQIGTADFAVCGCTHIQKIGTYFDVKLNNITKEPKQLCLNHLCYMNGPYDHIETNSVWGKLYKKEIVKEICFEPSVVLGEDFIFNYDYIMRSSIGVYLDYTAYNYYEHSDSNSRNFNRSMMKTIDVMERLIKEQSDKEVLDPLISRCVNIAFTILMMVPAELKAERERIEYFISKYRKLAIRNHKTKFKVKVACLTSFMGFGVTRKLFEMTRM